MAGFIWGQAKNNAGRTLLPAKPETAQFRYHPSNRTCFGHAKIDAAQRGHFDDGERQIRLNCRVALIWINGTIEDFGSM
jgi:hypothetical protein